MSEDTFTREEVYLIVQAFCGARADSSKIYHQGKVYQVNRWTCSDLKESQVKALEKLGYHVGNVENSFGGYSSFYRIPA